MIRKLRNFSNSILLVIILSLTLVGCNKKIESTMEYNNDAFTQKLYEQLVEIDYWNGGDKIAITNKAAIQKIYSNFASLKLSEAQPEDTVKCGHLSIDLVTNDETIPLGLLSGEVCINNTRYYTDKDIVDSVRDIAIKNQK